MFELALSKLNHTVIDCQLVHVHVHACVCADVCGHTHLAGVVIDHGAERCCWFLALMEWQDASSTQNSLQNNQLVKYPSPS